jgi:hypothetical protein
MPRAILLNGLIYPLEPLPAGWQDGQELWVEESPPESPEALDRWCQEMEALCATGDPEDDKRLEAALAELRRQDKALARRETGLPDSPQPA